jgi:hypothetical protein
VHTQVASHLKGAKLELKELKARSLLLGACLECPKLETELDASSLKVKELEKNCLGSHVFQSLHPLLKFVGLSRVSFSVIPKRTST